MDWIVFYRIDKIQIPDNTKCWWGNGATLISIYFYCWCKYSTKCCNHIGRSSESFLKYQIYTHQMIQTLHSRKMIIYIHKKICKQMLRLCWNCDAVKNGIFQVSEKLHATIWMNLKNIINRKESLLNNFIAWSSRRD